MGARPKKDISFDWLLHGSVELLTGRQKNHPGSLVKLDVSISEEPPRREV